MRKTVFSAVFVLLCLVCGASVPMLINYPGKLTNKDGSPITASKNISFAFYDSESGGAQKWNGSYQIEVSKGVFNVLLGSGLYPFGASVDFSQDYWLEMKVEGETLSPRQRISSVVYSIRSEYCNRPDTPMVISGSGDIDENVSEKCYFVLSKVPRSITLYLYGERFNTQFYTELAYHNHGGSSGNSNVAHSHTVAHSHSVLLKPGDGLECAVGSVARNPTPSWGAAISTDCPTTSLSGTEHIHSIASSGVSIGKNISSEQKQYLDDMRVFLDGENVSNEITGTLLSKTTLAKFGDGTYAHPLNSPSGSGAIDVAAMVVTTGQHWFVFKQSGSNRGGRIRYYLYVTY